MAATTRSALKVLLFCLFTAGTSAYSQLTNEIRLGVEKELRGLVRVLLRYDDLLEYDEDEKRPNSTEIIRLLDSLPPLSDDAYLTGHPVGIFSVNHGLRTRWPSILSRIRHHKHYQGAFKLRIEKLEEFLPEDRDVRVSARNVLLTQRVYDISTHDVTAGTRPAGPPVSAETCFHLAEAAQDLLQPYYSVQWYQTTLELCESEGLADLCLKAKSRLAAMYYKARHLDKAIQLAREIAEADPSNDLARHNLAFYERVQRDDSLSSPEVLEPVKPTRKIQIRVENVCSGKVHKPSRLSCYHQFLSPFEPVKVEIVHSDPDVTIYYDVMSSNSSQTLVEGIKKELANTIYDSPKDIQHNWAHLTPDNGQVHAVDQHFLRLVNQTMETKSDFMAVAHGSAVRQDNLVNLKEVAQHGWNTATFMVFLNDVEEGGEVVFHRLKLRIPATRGAGVMWHNVLPIGKVDRRLRWAECPVIRGGKMVMYKIYQIKEAKPEKDEDDGKIRQCKPDDETETREAQEP